METKEPDNDNISSSSIAQEVTEAIGISQAKHETDDITSISSIAKGLALNKHLKWILAVIALVLVIVIGFVFLNQGQTKIGDGYEITNQKLVQGDPISHITGTVKNTCGRTETLLISWTLYDSNKNKIGTAFAAVSDLPDGASEDFEAFLDTSENPSGGISDATAVKSFEVESVAFMKAENARLENELNALKSKK